jgi:4-hydroxybenzoate polyprenyltransferase
MMIPQKPSLISFFAWGIRYDNIVFFLGFPLLGALFALPGFGAADLKTLAVFGILCVLFLAQSFMFNDWGDARQNPEEPQYRKRHALKHPELIGLNEMLVVCAAMTVVSVAGIFRLSVRSGEMMLAAAAISFIYSHPWFALKKRPGIPELAHILFAGSLFLSGWLVFSELSRESLLLALFFGLVLSAGDLINQVEDFEKELALGLRTSAVVFGKRQIYRLAVWVFWLSALGLLGIALTGLAPGWIKWPSLVLIAIWTGMIIFLARTDMTKIIPGFSVVIRAIYLIFSLCLVAGIIIGKV